MKFNRLLAILLMATGIGTAHADLPYRQHRYDSFMATPPAATEGSRIVFFGNSITNMHNWNEAFGSDPEVVNRGNSGGFVYELIEEVECLTDSKPAKVFIGIGTNDLSSGRSPEQVTADTRTLVRRIQIASPETEINVQSILPRSNDVWYNIQKTIPMVKAMCEEMGVNFIDLTDTMMGVRTATGSNPATTWAPDGLHPSGRGYRAWCEFIKDRVNGVCSYSSGNYHSNLTALSNPSRISQFSLLPVNEGDILFVGDEMVENGEWNELLSLPQIKKRSNGYGHGGISLLGTNGALDLLRVSLTTDASTQKSPAKILIYCGVTELANSTSAATYKGNYQTLIKYIKQVAPSTAIYAVSMLSVNNDNLARQYNAALKEIADADDSVTFIDIYTAMKDNAANSMQGNYVNGRGYVRIANLLAPYLEADGAKAVSLDDFEKYYANRMNRKAVGMVYNRIYSALLDPANFGNGFGQYSADRLTAMTEAAAAIEAALASATVTDSQKDALVKQANDAIGDINLPDGFDGRYYRLTSDRGSASIAISGNVINGVANLSTTVTDGSDVWHFEKRADGDLNIVSLSGKYIQPNSGSTSVSVSVSESQPSMGWKVAKSDYAAGTIVIYGEKGTAKWQLNQQSGGNNIWNWYGTSCPNLSDQGCAYHVTEFTGRYVAPGDDPSEENPLTGWYLIEGATGFESLGSANLMTNVDTEWRQNTTNSYALKYAAESTTHPAKHFIHVTVKDDEKWYFTSANGHGVQENATSTRTSIPSNTVSMNPDGDLWQIGKWTHYTTTDNNWHEFPIVGKSSSSDVRHKVTKVSDETLALYDIWTVEIIGNPASEVINDLTVSLDIEANKGITTVYNGGTYFLTKGTTLKSSDFTFGGNTSAQLSNVPALTIDNKAHTIVADFTSMPATEGKWYTIALHSKASGSNASLAGWVSTAMADGTNILQSADEEYYQNLGGSANYYGVAVSSAPETTAAAKAFFYMTETGTNTSTVRTINGHYVLDNGCATITPTPLQFTPHASEANVYSTTWCIWKENNIGAPVDLIGKFSGNSCYFTIEPADLDAYDVYTVEVKGHEAAANVSSDMAVTLNGVKHYGLASVYDGGAFFVDKGATVTPDMIQAADKPTAVKVTTGKILVSYDDGEVSDLTGITLSES
ncbi:MAG: hypothetical protein K2M97_00430, partial [Muribaculaceae bacterium]|nr:hypothetical protein [Muribaculaceae bacterium]